MNINWDIQKLNDVLQDVCNACGINVSVVNKYFSSLGYETRLCNNYCHTIQESNLGKDLCKCSDIILYEKCQKSKKTEMHICHAGLIDVAVPIIWNEEILGYIILGQMRKDIDFNAVFEKTSKLPINKKELEHFYKQLPLFDAEKINSVANIATMISKYILFENIFNPEINAVIEKATDFMDKNFQNNISIQNIVDATGISKSTLYKNFAVNYKCTPGEYLNKIKVEKSLELLLHTDFSIEEISQQVSFSSAAYYSKIFKKLKGISPLKFKKIQITY